MQRKAAAASSTPRPPKREIHDESTSPLGFLYMCLTFIFKRFVFASTHVKIGIYFSALIVGSLMKDFNLVYKSPFFTNKYNFINLYFAKLSWFWTLLVTLPFILMTSLVYSGGNQLIVRNNLFRLVVATALWFVWTKLFDLIDTNTGSCLSAQYKDKPSCKQNRHEWIGFDISGHTFIFMHALFLMLEEVKVYNVWEQLRRRVRENIAKLEQQNTTGNCESNCYGLTASSESLIDRATYWYLQLNTYIKLNFFFMAMLALLWEVLLLTTFIYYHTIMHKVLAAFCATISWFVTYKLWYVNKDFLMSPGHPANGIERLVPINSK